MQQTDKYQLNLIETSDTFSPAPLNENAQKLESALASEAQARAETDAALDARLQVFEARHLVIGKYTGDGASSRDLMLGFTPEMAVIVYGGGSHVIAFLGSPAANSLSGIYLEIIDGGIRMHGNYNTRDTVYDYAAIK